MKRLWVLASIFAISLCLFGGFSIPKQAFAAGYDENNADLIQQLNERVTKSSAFENFSNLQKEETLRELETFTSFAKEYPKDQNTKEYYQQMVFTDWINNKISPLKDILPSNLRVVPIQIEGIATTFVNEVIMKDNASYSSGLVSASGGAGVITTEASALQDAKERSDKAKEVIKDDGCGILGWSIGGCINVFVTYIIKKTLLEIAGWLLWLSANMFNYSVRIGILDFKSWAPDSLYPIWMIIRQIVSLVVVFAGLYLGFLYILGKEQKFEHFMPWLVMFALFVNFSYPLARTAVDISNIISLNIYASTMGNEVLNRDALPNTSAGAIIVSKLGLNGLTSSAASTLTSGGKDGLLTGVNTISGSLMVVLFVAYTAYIFLMVTGIMVMRTASLVFIIIASPFLFIDSVVPGLGEKAKEIRGIFFKQLIVGPVFMIMLALTLKFLEVFSTAGGMSPSGVTSAVAAGGQETVKIFFNLTMMLIMLHIMITVTKEVAGKVGNYMSNALGTVGGFAGGAALGVATGGAGLLARGTIGRGAAAMLQPGGMMDKWKSASGVTGAVGRRFYNLTDTVAKSSFDARNSSYVQTGATKLGLSKGMGTGNKAGYEAAREARIQLRAEQSKDVGTYRTNVYERDEKTGNTVLKFKKGAAATDNDAAMANRAAFAKNAGNQSVFSTVAKAPIIGALAKPFDASEQEKLGTENAIASLQKNEKQTMINDALTEYKKLEGQEKQEYLTNQKDDAVRAKLLEADQKEEKEKANKELKEKQVEAFGKKTQDTQEAILEELKKQNNSANSKPVVGSTTLNINNTPTNASVILDQNGAPFQNSTASASSSTPTTVAPITDVTGQSFAERVKAATAARKQSGGDQNDSTGGQPTVSPSPTTPKTPPRPSTEPANNSKILEAA